MATYNITVENPVLTPGMSFRVRYRKEGTGTWSTLYPFPTTNTFQINGLDDAPYELEIRTICKNGTISAPQFHLHSCEPPRSNPPEINIVWHDTQDTVTKYCASSCSYGIDHYAFDADNDIVQIICQRSSDGNSWGNNQVVTGQNFIVNALNDGNTYFRFQAIDAANNSANSNILTIHKKSIEDPTISSVTSLPNDCIRGSGAGESVLATIQGQASLEVFYQVQVLDTYGHGSYYTITQGGTDILDVSLNTSGQTYSGSFMLDTNGETQLKLQMCLRPCLNSNYSQMSVRFSLYESDGVTVNYAESIVLSASMDCP